MSSDELGESNESTRSAGPEKPPVTPPAPNSEPGWTKEDLATHSVYNELNIFPGRPNEIIQSDWRCSDCGYNLRGTMTGNRCPECGSIELYRPPPPGEVSYATWFEERRKNVSNFKSTLVLLAVFLAGGPFAVLGTILSQLLPAPLGLVVVGPTIEEIMKIGLILLIIETRPYYIRREVELVYLALAGALGFAVIENLVYLNVYIKNPSYAVAMWRWSVCTALHVVCTLIATRGVVAVWRATEEQKRAPMMRLLFNPLITAIAIHGGYNAVVILAEYAGFAY